MGKNTWVSVRVLWPWPALSQPPSLGGQAPWPSEWLWMAGQAGARARVSPYLHGDVGCLQGHAVHRLIAAAAGAAHQGDAGWAEHVLHLAGVLRHDVHQPLHRPAVAAAPHLLEGHHCKEAQTAGSGPQAWQALPGAAHTRSSRKPPAYVSSPPALNS